MRDLILMVCPHDTVRKPESWYHLVQFLTARLDSKIHFEISLDFAEFRQGIASADLVYANPKDGLGLIDTLAFCPLARPANTYDEALLVAGPDGPLPALEAINGSVLATVESLLPTRLALKMLRERGIAPAGLTHRDSWLSVVRSVWNGEAPFGILYRDAYEELSPQGRAMIRVLDTTSERSAFHMFTARPGICDDMARFTNLLVSMASTPDGKSVLDDLGITSWVPVSADELAGMRAVLA
jgi:hypothetical protein